MVHVKKMSGIHFLEIYKISTYAYACAYLEEDEDEDKLKDMNMKKFISIYTFWIWCL